MTRLTKILAILVLLIGAGSAWADLTDGLVAHWKFDEGTGLTAYDSAGDNDGTLVNGPLRTAGIIDGALEFDGANDYVDLGNDVSLKPSLPVTVSAWVNLSESGKHHRIISIDEQSPATYYGFWLHILSTDRLRVGFGDGTGGGSQVYRRSKVGTTILDANTWYHVAAVIRGATDMDIYINGIDDGGSYEGSGSSLAYSSGTSYIAREKYSNTHTYFDGLIDDVRVYDVALSAVEVEELYLAEELELVGLEIAGPDEVAENHQTQYQAIAIYDNNTTADVTHLAKWSVEPNLIADIEAGLLATDKIFEPQAVTITAEYTEADITAEDAKEVSIFAICPTGTALQFDGVNDYADCGSTFADVVGSATKTVMAWAKSDTTSYPSQTLAGAGRILTLYRESGSSGFTIYAQGEPATWRGLYRKAANVAQDIDSGVSVIVNAWTHVALVQDGADVDIYINGVSENSASDGATPTTRRHVNGDIGAYDAETAMKCFFNGTIDEVAIYNTALTAEEIRALMHTRLTGSEDGLVAYWDFDEGEGQIVYDLSPNANHGQLGSDPNADDSDPAWVESDAPIGICAPEGLVERNVNEALEIKLNILDEILEALAREDASVNILDDLFGEPQYSNLDKRDIIKTKQEIHSAIQGEEQAIDSLEKSAGDLEDSLEALSGDDTSPDSPSPGSSPPGRQSKTLTKPAPTEVIRKPSRK